MPSSIALLWKAPNVNPVNHKAKSIPALNPLNTYGRVFLLSWWGFFVAFWSWYAFPPLMTDTIKKDLNLSQRDIANSDVISLAAAILVRLAAGPLCDRFGPRWTFAGILLVGSIPTALAGTVSTAQGLVVIRFFVGILGGSFIPCQVWTTGFFDKNIVGTANSLSAGFGNAGGGVTYFVMPAIFNSLVRRQHLTEHVAWRVAFVVPFILITLTALIMILMCPDTPTGAWSARTQEVQRHLDMRDTFFSGVGKDRKGIAPSMDSGASPGLSNDTIKLNSARGQGHYSETQAREDDLLAAASWELVEKPTVRGSVKAILSFPTMALSVAYFCSFGTELCVNTILGAYYAQTFSQLGQTGSGNWAAMFGLLNFVFRPAGGIISDTMYRYTRSLWGKKILIHVFGLMTGVFLLVIGFLNPNSKATFVGLITGLAFFEEAGNGGLFSLVPHVHPTSNGLITGVTGAAGDLGGIVFLLIYRYSGTDYGRVFWITPKLRTSSRSPPSGLPLTSPSAKKSRNATASTQVQAYVVDRQNDANTYWDETTGLTAQDTSASPSNEDELYKSVFNHFCLPTPSPYVPVLHRQHVDIEDLKEQVGKEILVLEIDVENKMPEAHIYPVRDLLAAREGEWAEDPREEWWMETYLILHRVPRDAITVYTPNELIEKELEDTRQRLPAPYNESFGPSLAPQAAEGGHLNQVQDAGSRKEKSKQMFKRLLGGKRQ